VCSVDGQIAEQDKGGVEEFNADAPTLFKIHKTLFGSLEMTRQSSSSARSALLLLGAFQVKMPPLLIPDVEIRCGAPPRDRGSSLSNFRSSANTILPSLIVLIRVNRTQGNCRPQSIVEVFLIMPLCLHH
jgi:hypothetical protein